MSKSKSITEMALWLCGLEAATVLINDEKDCVWLITHDGFPSEHGRVLKNGAVTYWDSEEEKFRVCERIPHRLEAFNDYVQDYKSRNNTHESLRQRVLSGETYAH